MRIGCDLVEVRRIGKLINSTAFLERVFHADEIAYCASLANPAPSFAARFAAKEAFSKALGTGIFAHGVHPVDIWISREPSGRPVLNLAPHVRELMEQLGYHHHDISLSHQDDYAMATVLLF